MYRAFYEVTAGYWLAIDSVSAFRRLPNGNYVLYTGDEGTPFPDEITAETLEKVMDASKSHRVNGK